MILNDVKSRLDSYMKQRLGMYEYRRGWLKGDCPSCGKHKFGVNISINVTNCFRCGYNDKPLYVVLNYESLDTIGEVFNLLKEFDGDGRYYKVNRKANKTTPLFKEETNTKGILPEGYNNIMTGDSILANSARNYLTKRGFNIKKLGMAGWGYCTKGEFMGYIIIPYHYQGRLIYFTARRLVGDGPKFKNPKIENIQFGKSMLIYNIDALKLYKKVWITESITNAETIGDNAIAIGGKDISNYQLNEIIKSPTEKIIIGLDPDAKTQSIELAKKLIEHKKVKIMKYEDEIRDINELGKKKVFNLISKQRYQNYNSLLQLSI